MGMLLRPLIRLLAVEPECPEEDIIKLLPVELIDPMGPFCSGDTPPRLETMGAKLGSTTRMVDTFFWPNPRRVVPRVGVVFGVTRCCCCCGVLSCAEKAAAGRAAAEATALLLSTDEDFKKDRILLPGWGKVEEARGPDAVIDPARPRPLLIFRFSPNPRRDERPRDWAKLRAEGRPTGIIIGMGDVLAVRGGVLAAPSCPRTVGGCWLCCCCCCSSE